MRLSTVWTVLVLTTNAQRISTSARCGPTFGLTCQGSTFGNCCSQYNYCGSTTAYCGTGCQKGWGTCKSDVVSSSARSITTPSSSPSIVRSSSTRPVSSPAASPTQKVSKNARCGYLFNASGGQTCLGSVYGDCCSNQSYCGSTEAYCGNGCQPGYGKCNPVSSPVLRSSSTLATSVRSSTPSVVSSSSMVSSGSVALSAPSSVVTSSAPNVSPSSPAASSIVSVTSSAQAQSSVSSSVSSSTTSLPSDVSSSAASSSPASSPANSPTPSTDILSTSARLTSSAIVTPSDTPTPTPTPTPSPIATCGVNVVTNPGFETGRLAPWQTTEDNTWTYTIKTPDGHESPNYLSASGNIQQNQAFHLRQSVTIAQTAQAEVSVWVRITGASSASTYFAVTINDQYVGTGNPNKYVAVGAGWTKVVFGTKALTPDEYTMDLYVMRNSGPTDQVIDLDDFSLVPACA